jgi:recombination protein RecA
MAKKKTKEINYKKRDDLLTNILGAIDGAQLLGSDGLAIKIRGVLSTQSPGIDAAIGRGGIPFGRLSILAGLEGSGKTTLALQLVAECQRRGGVAIYIDKEYKLDPDYAKAIGVDIEHLVIIQPDYLEKVFEAGRATIEMAAKYREKTGERIPILFVLDSMNAAIAKSQYEGEFEDKQYSPQARVFSESLPKFLPLVSKEDVALLFLSQIRKKIGVMFGDDYTLSGGNAPRHYASLIMHISRGQSTKDKETYEKTANIVKVECIKNQIAPPFRKTEILIEYGKGINRAHSLIWHCENLGIIKKNGPWISFGEENIGQGIKACCEKLAEDPKLFLRLKKALRQKVGW